MKSKLLSVYTDASGDDSKGTIAFSVWYRGKCLGRFTSVLNDYDCGNSSVLELIAIRTALSWVSENYPEKKIKLVTDSDSAVKYINHKHLITTNFCPLSGGWRLHLQMTEGLPCLIIK